MMHGTTNIKVSNAFEDCSTFTFMINQPSRDS